MPLTTFAGGRLFGARHGHDRPWVLALHGWQRSHRDFAATLEGLDVLAVDLPGFGAAPAPPGGWSTAEYAEWVAPILGEMAPCPVVLGHSFGGRVAVHLAARHADQVGALVLTGVPLVAPPGAPVRSKGRRAFRVGRALHRAHLVGDARMEAMRHRYGSADYRAVTGVMREVLVKAVGEDRGYGDLLSSFPGPVELVWGADDMAAPVTGARAALERCQHGRLTVAEADHFTPQHATAELRAALARCRPV